MVHMVGEIVRAPAPSDSTPDTCLQVVTISPWPVTSACWDSGPGRCHRGGRLVSIGVQPSSQPRNAVMILRGCPDSGGLRTCSRDGKRSRVALGIPDPQFIAMITA
jgi:hypothetical protein